MDKAYSSITTCELYAIPSCSLQWLQDDTHGLMEQTLIASPLCTLCHVAAPYFVNGEIAKKDAGMLRRFTSNGFGKVAESEIYRVGRLAA